MVNLQGNEIITRGNERITKKVNTKKKEKSFHNRKSTANGDYETNIIIIQSLNSSNLAFAHIRKLNEQTHRGHKYEECYPHKGHASD